MSSRLRSSSRVPAIQYSRSGDARASAQEGSSFKSMEGVDEPSAIAARTSVTLREGSSQRTSRGKSS
jgi:hypothetical protein